MNGRIGRRTLRAGVRLFVGSILVGLIAQNEPAQAQSHGSKSIARGAGTTIIEGGTGLTGGYVPSITTIAFHAEQANGVVTGAFECLARLPETATGAKSGEFTVNFMYVTGQITGAQRMGEKIVLTGISVCTGFGAGSNVSFRLVVQPGGPGATAELTVSTLPGVVFKEILLEGQFRVF